MSKKILVKEAGLVDFFKSFFAAKSKGKESEWLQRLRKADPKLADIWNDYDQKLTYSLNTQKKILSKYGIDTSEIDDLMNKYGMNKV